MLILRILSGASAGQDIPASRFPFRLGRKAPSDLILNEPGVWDSHAEIVLGEDRAFSLRSLQDADVYVGDKHGRVLELKNGDRIRLGNTECAIYLTPPVSSPMNAVLEWAVWGGLAVLFAFQFWLMYSSL